MAREKYPDTTEERVRILKEKIAPVLSRQHE
jgi:hypothetical protein